MVRYCYLQVNLLQLNWYSAILTIFVIVGTGRKTMSLVHYLQRFSRCDVLKIYAYFTDINQHIIRKGQLGQMNIQFIHRITARFTVGKRMLLYRHTKVILKTCQSLKTYTNEGEIVLDNCMGSGSTGVACMNTNRRFIGFELDTKYFNTAKERLKL